MTPLRGKNTVSSTTMRHTPARWASWGLEALGYYKICSEKPDNYWEAHCLLKDSCPTQSSSAREALRTAEDLARRQISNLPPLAQLPAYGQKRPFYSFELSTYGAQD